MLVRRAVDEHMSLLSEEEGLCGRVFATCFDCILRERVYVATGLGLEKATPEVA